MAHIDGELEHNETILDKFLAEQRRILPLLLGISGKIEKHQNPHNSIFAKSVHHITGYSNLRNSPAKHFCNDTAV